MNHDEAVVQDRVVKYSPGPTVKRFGNSKAFVRGMMGPIGSGKSVGCVIEIVRHAKLQEKGPDGIRRTRWAVIRNSYPELKSTTMKTWSEWMPGKISGAPPYTYLLETDELHVEVIFLALDHPDDARKVLSLEVTGVWINEAREVPKTIIDGLTGRVGRYPSKNMGGCTWSGIIMDTNPPDSESWWYKMAELEHPEGWEFFKQPSGDSPEAENLDNLPPKYYERIKAGKDAEWIKVYVKGEYGFVIEGNPVYPQFRDSFHVAIENIIPDNRISLQIGLDFGLTPAAVIGQRQPNGSWLIIDELVSDNSGIIRFAETLTAYMQDNYPEYDVSGCFGDPAGVVRHADERSSFDIMNAHSPWKWKPASDKNDIPMRLEVVKAALNRAIDGKPGFLVSPKCSFLRKGFNGGYHYKLLRSGDGTQSHSEPNKNQYSHCFVAGTLVDTKSGRVPIEGIKNGDMVLSPGGYFEVTGTLSRQAGSLVKITFSSGESVVCTADHPFYRDGSFIRADLLSKGDQLISSEGICRDPVSIQLKNLMVLSFIGNRTATIRRIIKSVASTCTDMFGHIITVKFRTNVRSIIKTKINPIMRLATWSSSQRQNILLCTAVKEFTPILQNQESTWQPYKKKQSSGTNQNSDVSGIQNTERDWQEPYHWKSMFALCVKSLTRLRKVVEKKVSARLTVSQKLENYLGSMTLQDSASFAKNLSKLTSTLKNVTVVEVVPVSQQSRVFDLTIKTSHCFFANGVLVSNCHDALQYLLLGAGEANVVLNKEKRKQNRQKFALGMDYRVFKD